MDEGEAQGHLKFRLDIGSGRSPERETERADRPPAGAIWEDRQLGKPSCKGSGAWTLGNRTRRTEPSG